MVQWQLANTKNTGLKIGKFLGLLYFNVFFMYLSTLQHDNQLSSHLSTDILLFIMNIQISLLLTIKHFKFNVQKI